MPVLYILRCYAYLAVYCSQQINCGNDLAGLCSRDICAVKTASDKRKGVWSGERGAEGSDLVVRRRGTIGGGLWGGNEGSRDGKPEARKRFQPSYTCFNHFAVDRFAGVTCLLQVQVETKTVSTRRNVEELSVDL